MPPAISLKTATNVATISNMLISLQAALRLDSRAVLTLRIKEWANNNLSFQYHCAAISRTLHSYLNTLIFCGKSRRIGVSATAGGLPCSVCEVDSARAPQLDWTSGPRMVTSELPRFISAAFRGATWLNWTAERQPTKPCDAACDTFSLKFSLPVEERGVRVRQKATGSRLDAPPGESSSSV